MLVNRLDGDYIQTYQLISQRDGNFDKPEIVIGQMKKYNNNKVLL